MSSASAALISSAPPVDPPGSVARRVHRGCRSRKSRERKAEPNLDGADLVEGKGLTTVGDPAKKLEQRQWADDVEADDVEADVSSHPLNPAPVFGFYRPRPLNPEAAVFCPYGGNEQSPLLVAPADAKVDDEGSGGRNDERELVKLKRKAIYGDEYPAKRRPASLLPRRRPDPPLPRRSPRKLTPMKPKGGQRKARDPNIAKVCSKCGDEGHASARDSICRLNKGRLKSRIEKDATQTFTIKLPYEKFIRRDGAPGSSLATFRRQLSDYLSEAVDRYNVYVANLVFVYHFTKSYNNVPEAHSLRTIAYCISGLDQGHDDGPATDRNLATSIQAVKLLWPFDLPYRRGLTEALALYEHQLMTNVRLHIVTHLVRRLSRYLDLVLEREALTLVKGVRDELRKRIISHFVWNEAAVSARARARLEAVPGPPAFVLPDPKTVFPGGVPNELTAVEAQAIDAAVWSVIDRVEDPVRDLPLCPRKFGKNITGDKKWMRYYRLHVELTARMERHLELRQANPPVRDATQIKQASHPWARREVTAAFNRIGIKLTTSALKKIQGALRAAVNFNKPDLFDNCTSTSLRDQHAAQVALRQVMRTSAEAVADGTFTPSPFSGQRRGLARGHSLLPVHSFKTQHMRVDTRGLSEMLIDMFYKRNTVWPGFGPGRLSRPARQTDLQRDIDDNPGFWWKIIANVTTMSGVVTMPEPNLVVWRGNDHTKRIFGYSIMTDGVGVSATCKRPPNPPRPALTAATAIFRDETNFVAVDPGLRSPMTAVTWPRIFGEYVDSMGCYPTSSGDIVREARANGTEFVTEVRGSYWHHLAFHNRAKKLQKDLDDKFEFGDEDDNPLVRRQALLELREFTTTAKTADYLKIEAYIEEHLPRYRLLYEHQRDYRLIRFITFSRTQAAFAKVCKAIVGRSRDVIVAFGAGGFGATLANTASGLRAVPTVGFRKALARHPGVQLVLTDEFRTSRACSNPMCWPQDPGVGGVNALQPAALVEQEEQAGLLDDDEQEDEEDGANAQ
ncbi:hypothetical protein HK101_011223, partial [Irineochytrium annulatum]